MKNILLFIIVSFFSLLSSSYTYAATQTDANWENIVVSAVYEEFENIIYVAGIVPASIKGAGSYTLGLNIAGKSYRKPLNYNLNNNHFEVVFTIPQNTLTSSYSYNISIKNSQYYELYKDSRILYFNGKIGTSTPVNNQSTGSDTTSTAQITVTKIISNMNKKGYSTSQKVTYIENLMIVLANYNSSKTWEQVLIKEVIEELKIQREVYKGTYIPSRPTPGIYPSKQAEPNKINGIGNNPSYKSWRVSQ